jgi:hypothetical protein
MVDAGCARGKVGSLMQRVGDIFGVHIDRKMDRRTVSRAIGEGGVAAKMQVTYELGLNKGKLTDLTHLVMLKWPQELRLALIALQIAALISKAHIWPIARQTTSLGTSI